MWDRAHEEIIRLEINEKELEAIEKKMKIRNKFLGVNFTWQPISSRSMWSFSDVWIKVKT